MKKRIAIIGAGISGLTLAQNLKDCSEVVVFDKARGVGGRMSTRHAEPFYFDHGTQFFTARSKAFQAFIAPLIAKGIVAEWKGKVITFQADNTIKDRLWFEPHYVAVPHMNSLAKHMADGLDVRLNTEVGALADKQIDGWHLSSTDGCALGVFDWVIATAPAPQSVNLLQSVLADDSAIHRARLKGCFTLLIGIHAPWTKPWMAAKVHQNPIEWIAVSSSKPGRSNDITALVVHSNNDWADSHMQDDVHQIQDFLLQQFESITGIACKTDDFLSLHRWKYALVDENEKSGTYLDPHNSIAATGDWASASRIEAVWLNAVGLAKEIKQLVK
jgi:predicted NAD/FAD-dependent oxidoreductase